MADTDNNLRFLQLFERLERLHEASNALQRAITAFTPAFQRAKSAGYMTDEQWTELQSMDYTADPEYLKEDGNPKGRFNPGDLARPIFALYFSTVAKPKRDITFSGNDEQKKAAIERQRQEVAEQVRLFWEDAYKIKRYIKIFALNTKLFAKKNLQDYESFDELKKAALPIEKEVGKTTVTDTGEETIEVGELSDWDKNKLHLREKYKKYYLDKVPGTSYDVYEFPKGMDLEEAKDMQQDLGTGTEWCTVPRTGTFLKGYLDKNALYIFYGDGPDDRYQFYYGEDKTGNGAQFMDVHDVSILDKIGVDEEEA